MSQIQKILIIEDSEDIVEAINIALKIRWPFIKIFSTESGEEGLELIEKGDPNVVILDIGLPDINGYNVLKNIRLFSDVPVMILTVRGDEADIVKGLELGADEYIVKPFKQLELLSRIRVITRRKYACFEENPITKGNCTLNPSERIFSSEQGIVNLTKTESILMAKLMINEGNLVTYDSLAIEVWGNDYPDSSAALRVYIKRLREKIEHIPNQPRHIITRSGLGYIFKSNK